MVDTSTAEIVKKFYDSEATYGHVTSMALYDNTSDLRATLLAVGFSTGHVIVYDFETIMQKNSGPQNVEFLHKFNLHKSGIASLAFDKTGSVLASGGFDTYIVVYDIIEGASLYKLLGHKDIVTHLQFHLFPYVSNQKHEETENNLIQSKKSRQFDEMLISGSKDTSLKIWDLESQFCAQTLMDANQKVYSFTIMNNIIIVGGEDEHLRAYRCGIKQVSDTHSISYLQYADLIGTFKKQGSERLVELSLSSDERYLIATSADGNVEVFKFNTENEIYKKLLRAAKKQARKRTRVEMDDEEENKVAVIKVDKEKVKQQVILQNYDAKFIFSSV